MFKIGSSGMLNGVGGVGTPSMPVRSLQHPIPAAVLSMQVFSKCLLYALAENMTTTDVSGETFKTLYLQKDMRLKCLYS